MAIASMVVVVVIETLIAVASCAIVVYKVGCSCVV